MRVWIPLAPTLLKDSPPLPRQGLPTGLHAGPYQGRSVVRSAVNRRVSPAVRSVLTLLFLFLVAAGTAAFHPEAGAACPLPQHCDELIHGDCDDPWLCFVACFMEMLGLEDYCSQHPNSPQCQ